MSGGDTRIDIPLNRLAWMLTFTVMPTTLAGLLGIYGFTMAVFLMCVVLSLAMAALAIGDWLVQTSKASTNLAAMWLVFLGLPAMALVEGLAYGKAGYLGLACASAGYVTVGTLLFAWEGVSLVLLLVNALNAAGTAWALSEGDLKLASIFGVGSLVLGLGVAILRGVLRSRRAARR